MLVSLRIHVCACILAFGSSADMSPTISVRTSAMAIMSNVIMVDDGMLKFRFSHTQDEDEMLLRVV
jgi:hypothetical protein